MPTANNETSLSSAQAQSNADNGINITMQKDEFGD